MSNALPAQNIHTAMADLRKGKITPDEFRAIMRTSKAQNGAAAHEQARNLALASAIRKGF